MQKNSQPGKSFVHQKIHGKKIKFSQNTQGLEGTSQQLQGALQTKIQRLDGTLQKIEQIKLEEALQKLQRIVEKKLEDVLPEESSFMNKLQDKNKFYRNFGRINKSS